MALIVSIELFSAVTRKSTLLGRTVIYNTGEHRGEPRGDYVVAVGRRGRLHPAEILEKPLRKGYVQNYPRLAYNVWRLVIRALLSAFPEERRARVKSNETARAS